LKGPVPEDDIDPQQYRNDILALASAYRNTDDIREVSEKVEECIRRAYVDTFLAAILELRGDDAGDALDLLQAVSGFSLLVVRSLSSPSAVARLHTC
jgi:hypothetical protein